MHAFTRPCRVRSPSDEVVHDLLSFRVSGDANGRDERGVVGEGAESLDDGLELVFGVIGGVAGLGIRGHYDTIHAVYDAVRRHDVWLDDLLTSDDDVSVDLLDLELGSSQSFHLDGQIHGEDVSGGELSVVLVLGFRGLLVTTRSNC